MDMIKPFQNEMIHSLWKGRTDIYCLGNIFFLCSVFGVIGVR